MDNRFCRHQGPLLRWLLRRGVSVNWLRIDKFSGIASVDLLGKVTKSLHTLFLWQVPHAKQVLVRNVLQASPSLHILSVDTTILDNAVCDSICEYCPNVRELSLTDTSLSYDSSHTMLQRLTHLTSLDLGYGVFTSAAMLGIAYHCPFLKHFKYNEGWCRDLKTVYLSKSLSSDTLSVICSICTQLVSLDLEYEWDARQTMRLNSVYNANEQRLPLLRRSLELYTSKGK